MKKRTAALAAAAVLCASCAGCAQPSQPAPPEDGYLIYFLAPENAARGGDRIMASYETLDLPVQPQPREEALAVVERLLDGPASGGMESPLPPGVEVISLDIRDRRAYIDLSGDFSRLSGIDLSMADYCLTLSLTALDGIGSVSITAQGREVGQQPKKVFLERDVLLSTKDDVLQTAEVTLYFLDENGGLVGEKRTIELYEGQTLAENLIIALLSGPENKDLRSPIPEDFAVNSVRVEDGVCFLNLAASSLALLPADASEQRLILWSLTDSLYSIETVREIHLLSDGTELESFGSVPVAPAATRPLG